jgi:hypothetical protein
MSIDLIDYAESVASGDFPDFFKTKYGIQKDGTKSRFQLQEKSVRNGTNSFETDLVLRNKLTWYNELTRQCKLPIIKIISGDVHLPELPKAG